MNLLELDREVNRIADDRLDDVIRIVIKRLTEPRKFIAPNARFWYILSAAGAPHGNCTCSTCQALVEYVELKLKLQHLKRNMRRSLFVRDDQTKYDALYESLTDKVQIARSAYYREKEGRI